MLHGSEGNVAWRDAIMENKTRKNLMGQEEHHAPVGLQDRATEAGVMSWDQSSTTLYSLHKDKPLTERWRASENPGRVPLCTSLSAVPLPMVPP